MVYNKNEFKLEKVEFCYYLTVEVFFEAQTSRSIYYIPRTRKSGAIAPLLHPPILTGGNIMKSFFKLLFALTLTTAFLFTGCNINTTDVSSDISSNISDPIPEISPEDLELAEKAASFLGAIHNVEVWNNADEIGVHMFYLWYIDYIASTTTYEERLERYKHENYELGWSYPQDEFEEVMQKYFDVSIEHLRSDEWCYHKEDGVYNLDYIGGANLRYKVKLAEELPTIDGDIMYIPMELSFDGDFRDTVYRTLVIQKTEDGYKYLESRFTVEKVDFSEFSMLVPKDMRVDNNEIGYYDAYYNKSMALIKLLEIYPTNAFEDVLLQTEKEYKESEFFARESEYSDDRISWKEYTVKIPLPEESGLDLTETFSYYFVNYKDMIIKFETRPLVYGSYNDYRNEIENILKTIE